VLPEIMANARPLLRFTSIATAKQPHTTDATFIGHTYYDSRL
jgi:hypothetical protein